MKKIAIVDDSNDQRDTYKKRLTLFLMQKGSTLEVIDTSPFSDISHYYEWIINEEIITLIFDEKLHIESQEGCSPVDYNGSFLVKRIRERFKDIPIFTLTNFPNDEDLQRNFSQFEFILSKSNFTEEYVDIILRAGQRYFDENQKQLSLYNELTRAISGGNNDPELIKKLQALQTKLELPFSGYDDRNGWLNKYESQIKSLETLNNIIKSKLESGNELEKN